MRITLCWLAIILLTAASSPAQSIELKVSFTGTLAGLSEPTKDALVTIARDAQAALLQEQTYRGQPYLLLSVGPAALRQTDPGEFVRQLRLRSTVPETERLRDIINKRVLPLTKALSIALRGQGPSVGLAIAVYEPPDTLEVCIPIELALAFSADDISSQKLIDGSILLLGGNRIELSLR